MASIPIPRSAARCGLVGVFILVCLGLVVSRKGGVLSSVNVRKSEGKATSNQYSLGGEVGHPFCKTDARFAMLVFLRVFNFYKRNRVQRFEVEFLNYETQGSFSTKAWVFEWRLNLQKHSLARVPVGKP